MTSPSAWYQVNITFPDWDAAERIAATSLAPMLAEAEAAGDLASWFFIRKAPCWRFRLQTSGRNAVAALLSSLEKLSADGRLSTVTPVTYEPETRAFGGTQSMTVAHHLFHQDSRHILTCVASQPPAARRTRELAVLLCAALMRGAGLDWYEQGDVWAQVASHRDPPGPLPVMLGDSMRQLMTASTLVSAPGCMSTWAAAFTGAGRQTAGLASAGHLHRGLREVLTHHVVFAWNRIGLPHHVQAVLASAAERVVFGPDPAASAHATQAAS